MSRPYRTAAAAAAAALSTTGLASAQVSVSSVVHGVEEGEECRIVRILPNGRRVVTSGSADLGVSASMRSSARGQGSASASSSVGASSSAGRSMSSASASANGRSRTVTITRDEDGCTVVIDQRRNKGTRR